MKKVLIILVVILILVIGAIVLGRCGRLTDPAPTPTPEDALPIVPEAAVATPEPELGEVGAAGMPITLRVEGPSLVQEGDQFSVSVVLASQVPVQRIAVRARFDPAFLFLPSVDPEVRGNEVVVPAYSEAIQALRNNVTEEGIIDVEIVGIGDTAVPDMELFILPLRGIRSGTTTVVVEEASGIAQDGTVLVVDALTPLAITIESAAPPTPAPTPTPIPTTPPPTSPPVVAPPICPPPGQPPVCTQPCPTTPVTLQPGVYYRIQRGQTLYSISRGFGTTVEAIVQANGITDVTAVPTGKLLYIPVCPPRGQAAYLVSTQETLYSIARTFGMTVEYLGQLNGIGPTQYNRIAVGEWLVLLP